MVNNYLLWLGIYFFLGSAASARVAVLSLKYCLDFSRLDFDRWPRFVLDGLTSFRIPFAIASYFCSWKDKSVGQLASWKWE